MKTANQYYQDKFKAAANAQAAVNKNQIVVLLGAPANIEETLDRNFFVDLDTFYEEKGTALFNKQWFGNAFSALNQPKQFHILSYAQFAHIIEYIDPSFFKERVVILKDNLRRIFPLKPDEYVQEQAAENLEERSEKMPAHHAEQIKVGGNFYYIAKDFVTDFETLDVFQESLNIKPASKDLADVLDITTDVYAIDLFVNSCIEQNTFNERFAVVLHEKYHLNTQLVQNLDTLNAVLAQFGGAIGYVHEEAVEEDYQEREETLEILKQYWGEHAGFRSLNVYKNPDIDQEVREISQGKIVETIITEYENAKANKSFRDLFLTAPTGAGKSLLFQLPAFYISAKGDVTIVVSPLIALMKDQVAAIIEDRKFEKVGYLNSELSLVDRDRLIESCKEGDIDVLYLSPELLLSYDIRHFIGERNLGLLVVDEAHLITTWGRDFRVDYWFLGNHVRKIRKYSGYKFPMVAVTATAVYGGSNDMVFDSIDSLVMQNPHVFIGVVKRNDISFLINNYGKFGQGYDRKKLEQTADFIQGIIERTHLKTLVYAPYKKHVDNITDILNGRNIHDVTKYYGSYSQELKQHAYSQFVSGEKQVMVSTKAFGMGVDISDIQVVYHHAPSGLLPDYVQEIGRLARDKELHGYAALNYAEQDQRYSKALHGMSALHHVQLLEVLKKVNSVYKKHKKQNLLVSVDDFAHIFEKAPDLDQKVLTALMMIEKDYLARYRFNVLIARPKKLFVKVFARATNTDANRLSARFGDAVHRLSYKKMEEKGFNILSIDLNKIWTEHFATESFPRIKHKFYVGKLFDKEAPSLLPQLKIEYQLDNGFKSANAQLSRHFEIIKDAFVQLSGHYFTQKELADQLNERYSDDQLATKVASFLISNYAGYRTGFNSVEENAFIARRRVGEEYDYRLMSTLYIREFSGLMKKLSKLFEQEDSKLAVRFVTNKESISVQYSRLGYFIELFELGTFEIAGGENPMVFIRINDPRRIESDSKSFYQNALLKKTLERHYLSTRIFDHFFLNEFTDEQRWEFIEEFFLGQNIDDLMERYPPSNNKPKVDILDFLQSNAKASKGGVKKVRKTGLSNSFPPDPEIFYKMDNLLTLKVNGKNQTKKVSKWLVDDPINLDEARKKNELKVDKEVFNIMVSKLKQYPEYFSEALGLKAKIEFPGYTKIVKAIVPYKDNPVEFYKWWKEDTSKVKLTFKEKLELIDKVATLDKRVLSQTDLRLLKAK